ncbi:MAG: hypothetical protein ACE37K_16620 [Planctomycetota bacterium]
MMLIRSTRLASMAGILTLAATGQGPNLLQNPGFESGSLTPWSVVSGSAAVSTYGSPELPGTLCSSVIGGGGLMLRDLGNGVIEQIVTPSSLPAGSHLVAEAFLGGGRNDRTRLVVRSLDGSGVQIGLHATAFVSDVERNGEAVLLERRLVVPIQPGTVRFAIRIEFSDLCCSGAAAAADLVQAYVTTGPVIPAGVPFGPELLANPGFEAGWQPSSPLHLFGGGWEGASVDHTSVRAYSDVDPGAPGGLVSCAIGGAAPNPSCNGGAAGNFLGHAGNASLRQTIDVRGSTSRFANGNWALRLGADLGGIGTYGDQATVEARFRTANGTALGSGTIGPVGAANRNYESTLVRRQRDLVVPANTAYIDVFARFSDVCCSGSFANVDNVSARLVAVAPPAPLQLQTNLLDNGSFEVGTLPGSPLMLGVPVGWYGTGAGRAYVPQYGTPNRPTSAFANAQGLGSLVLQDGGNARLVQTVDLRGSAGLVAAGRLGFEAAAWLGGVASYADTAEVRVRFQTTTGVATGPVVVLPAVTAAERQNQTTLIRRQSGAFVAPANASRCIVEVVFSDVCCSGAFGLADDVRLVAFDTAEHASSQPYPGTDPASLALLTGVDDLPRTGPGHVIQPATTGAVVTTRVLSPNATLDGAPVLLALDLVATGTAGTQYLPDIWVDPGRILLLYNGWHGSLFAPVVVPAAQGGNPFSLVVPPGLAASSLMLQAVALSPANAPSPNGVYHATEAHEIRVQ